MGAITSLRRMMRRGWGVRIPMQFPIPGYITRPLSSISPPTGMHAVLPPMPQAAPQPGCVRVRYFLPARRGLHQGGAGPLGVAPLAQRLAKLKSESINTVLDPWA